MSTDISFDKRSCFDQLIIVNPRKCNTSKGSSVLPGTLNELIKDKKRTTKRQKTNISRDKKITVTFIKDKNRPFYFQ